MKEKVKVKEKHKKGYIFFKYLLGWIFLAYYRPKVENKKVVPKDGPFIVCGNHIHVYDQCIPMLHIKRMLHYMAKKEYFDSKFAWFFKAGGCIPVNRQIHDDAAKKEALEVLNNGFGLGIFPEGTRNQVSCKKEIESRLFEFYKDDMTYEYFHKTLKKNQVRVSQITLIEELYNNKKITKQEYIDSILDSNKFLNELLKRKIIKKEEYIDSLMLPTKFGVVSMAQKTGATIVPYVVTGKYKFWNNKLKVTFLEPFKVGPKEDLEKANNHLRSMMVEELYKGNKL